MDNGQGYVDYYAVLKVNPDCDARILELAYHYFAKMYHPDNLETANADKFNEVLEAYRALRDPEKRAEYDRQHGRNLGKTTYRIPVESDIALDENTALSDAETHLKILLYLYKKRRENAADAGVIGWYVQEMLGCSEDEFQFHVWYLKSKGHVEVTEQGTIAVTVAGVDHVISNSRASAAETLLLRQAAGEN
ncbi:J domain-containing protein [Croceicoccus bisphenolivorans]|uniref:J domain-containing protein n=1 Tax=Croceicoccus bisphenolivorans TaxID=1783232 RepID=UPI00082B3EDC|nr:DnaJ domain-containing protein [Croceicoccus bisphenolivorans]